MKLICIDDRPRPSIPGHQYQSVGADVQGFVQGRRGTDGRQAFNVHNGRKTDRIREQ